MSKELKRWKKRGLLFEGLIIFLALSSVAMAQGQIILSPNRYVVLDDPNSASPVKKAAGFFDPSDVIGGSWNTNYWNGESTTIRAVAVVLNDTGTPLTGITVTFKLKDPGGTLIDSNSSVTNNQGIAYYYFDLNNRNYWGYWTIEGNSTVNAANINNLTSFALYWWGCGQCHGSEDPGKWGSKYTPKSYYTIGYDFHRSQDKQKHTDAMAKGTCIICHQMYNGTPANWGFTDNSPSIQADNEYSPDWHNGKKKCQDCHAGSNISTTPQGKNPEIAGCYDTAGCHPKKNNNVSGIISTTGYAVGGDYRTNYSFIPNNITKAHTNSGITCITCHNAGHKITKPFNASITSNSYTENEQCWSCHTNRPTTHYYSSSCVSCHSQNAHKMAKGGGPNCLECHNNSGTGATHKVDGAAISLGIHANLNANADNAGEPPENKKCWGCHQSDGQKPSGMGDIYKTPYKCFDCHNATKPYPNVSSAPTVSQHFENGNDIRAATGAADNSSSCIICHNLTEMKVDYTDTEFTDFSLPSHYGKNRSDLIVNGVTSCSYCHQNSTSAFAIAMIDPAWNSSIKNHTELPTNPGCNNSTCHDSGRIHFSTLKKPDVSSGLCVNCHISREKHNGSVECSQCHLESNKNIHPVQYLQPTGTFRINSPDNKSSAVDCTSCHQQGVAGFGSAPLVPDPFNHSNDPASGMKWGTFWDNTRLITACNYCHQKEIHKLDTELLGNVSLIKGSNTLNNPDLMASTWCANCHYAASSGYAGNQIAPAPPEITNGSLMAVNPAFFNHRGLSNFNDSECRKCHGSTLAGYAATTLNFSHEVSIGGGEECIQCHGTDYPGSSPSVVSTFVNITAFNESIHRDINATPIGVMTNDDCWTCHYNRDMNRQNVKKCDACHRKPRQWHGNANIRDNLSELW